MIQLTKLFPALEEHPHRGPWLLPEGNLNRTGPLELYIKKLTKVLGPGHPNIAVAESWEAIGQGAVAFDDISLEVLKRTEPVIREHFPDARRLLALNLAAQGCRVWASGGSDQAIAPLSEAFIMMTEIPICCEADTVKVAELLSDSLTDEERLDEALYVLAAAYPLYLAAHEQEPWLAGEYDEFREKFIEEHGDECRPEFQYLVNALRGPRLPIWAVSRP